jgi:hypothetical protein
MEKCDSECAEWTGGNEKDPHGRKLMVSKWGNKKYRPLELHPQCESCALAEKVNALMGIKGQEKQERQAMELKKIKSRLPKKCEANGLES